MNDYHSRYESPASLGTNPLPRLVDSALADRLRVMPAVVVTGARQTGKTVLVQDLTPGGRRYFTLDDLDTLEAARREPDILTGVSGAVALDEVQREPELLKAVKRAIDRERSAGRFLLTGSAHARRTGRTVVAGAVAVQITCPPGVCRGCATRPDASVSHVALTSKIPGAIP